MLCALAANGMNGSGRRAFESHCQLLWHLRFRYRCQSLGLELVHYDFQHVSAISWVLLLLMLHSCDESSMLCPVRISLVLSLVLVSTLTIAHAANKGGSIQLGFKGPFMGGR